MPVLPEKLEMVDPITHSKLLNAIAERVSPEEIGGTFVQSVIDRMYEISAGKGQDDEDTRQVVGLAAPQVGVGKRIVLIDTTANGANQEQNLIAIINPEIIQKSEETVPGREGCWSCGNVCGNVQRSRQVVLEGLDRHGKKLTLSLTEFVARIAQHETDHLDGVRFPDRIPVDEPEKLHWVEPAEFDEYRSNWEHWPNLCTREYWNKLKSGRLR